MIRLLVLAVGVLSTSAVAPAQAPPPDVSLHGTFEIAADAHRVESAGEALCASEPITHDAPIWSLQVFLAPAGAPESIGPRVWNDRLVFLSGGPLRRSVSLGGHEYEVWIRSTTRGEIEVSIDGLPLAAAADLRASLGSLVSTIRDLDLVAFPFDEDAALEIRDPEALRNHYMSLESRRTIEARSVREQLDTARREASETSEIDELTRRLNEIESGGQWTLRGSMAAAPATEEIDEAIEALRAPGRGFSIEEPCLQLSFNPIQGEEGQAAGVSMGFRYDRFYDEAGSEFIKLRAQTDSDLQLSSLGRAEVSVFGGWTLFEDRALRTEAGFSGGYVRLEDAGDRQDDRWNATLKVRLHNPSNPTPFGSLAGASTAPSLSLEAGAAGDADDESLFARAIVDYSHRFSQRTALDVDVHWIWSDDERFEEGRAGSRARAQLRFTVAGTAISDDWAFAVGYECNRMTGHTDCSTTSGLVYLLGR